MTKDSYEMIEVSTHSRPKAAGIVLHDFLASV